MSFTPVAGPTCLLKLGASPTTVPGMNWQLNIDAKLVDVSNFQTGRTPAATLSDVDLSFTLVWDQTAPPTDTDLQNIRDGASIQAQLFTASGKFFAFTGLIGTLSPGVSSLEDVLKLPVSAKINGTLTYPTNLS